MTFPEKFTSVSLRGDGKQSSGKIEGGVCSINDEVPNAKQMQFGYWLRIYITCVPEVTHAHVS